MWIELKGCFYDTCRDERKAYVNTDSISFFINTKRDNGTYYIHIQMPGHYLNWNCDDEQEMLKRYAWLIACVDGAAKPVKFDEQQPIETIADML